MSVPANIPWVAYGYAFYSSQDEAFGGFVRKLDEAKQECQAVAQGPLRWEQTDPGIWEARDPETGAIYEIDERAY